MLSIINIMKKNIFIILLILLFCAFPISKSKAASLYLSPESGEYSVASSFSVTVKVNSSDFVINAVDATIAYPADLLEVKSVSKSGSVLKLWTKEPTFSNSSGVVSFSGGVTAPGFTGIGTGLVINFVAKKEGQAQVSFSEGVVLAADGKGTNVLSSKSGGTYSIKKRSSTTEPSNSYVPPKEGSSVTEVNSTTHSDQNQWYNDQDPSFSWEMPANLTGVSIEFNNDPSSIPDQISEGLFDFKNYENIEDGIWYFHLRVENNDEWSKVAHFKVQIDASLPNNFEIRIDDDDKTNLSPSLYFNATDDLSGISHYDIKIDDNHLFSATPTEINPFIMPLQPPGLHKVIVTAIDKSGNRKDSMTTIDIKLIQIPEITVFPLIYNAGKEIMYIEGKSSPNIIIILDLKKDSEIVKTWEVTSDQDGNWIFSTEELFEEGTYKLSAKTKDERGVISNSSQENEIKVFLSGVMVSSLLITFWQLALLLFLVLILFIIILFAILYRIKKEKKAINKETKEAKLSLRKTFEELRSDLEKKIEYFDSKPGLSVKERKIRDSVFKILKDSEKVVEKEIEDIEKEI